MENLQRLVAKLLAVMKRLDDDPAVVVGYTAAYAVHVHEDMAAPHVTGNAKYLSRPLMRLRKELSKTFSGVVRRGGTVRQGMLAAGLRLQRESQKEVPVDTGALRASAFTREG